MNREDIIRMAVDAGIIPWTKHEYVGGNNFSASDEGLDGDLASLIQFAALVASAEREACAEIALTLTRRMKETAKAHYNHSAEPFIAERFGFDRGLILEGQKIADAIRARVS